MKKKKIQRRLDLNKQTIVNLESEKMAEVQGGCLTDLISWLFDCDTEFEKRPSVICNR